MMQGTHGMRLTMAILSPIFLLLCVVAIYGADTRPWVQYQKDFDRLYAQRATAKLDEAKAKKDTKGVTHWQHVLDELSTSKPRIHQIYLKDIEVADRCTTCHSGITNPLFKDAPQPFTTHPGDILKHHDVTRFGCTPCHDGQGDATTVKGAHGHEANWLSPLLPKAYVEISCPRCHEVTDGLKGAERVTLGTDLFMEKGCYGCHDVKDIKYKPKFAPPLTPLKTKLIDPKDYIYDWIKDPAKISRETAMPNFKLKDDEVAKITAFLLTLPEGEKPPPVSLDGASAKDGKRLFTERGCRGCHAVKPDEHSVSPRVPNLDTVGSKDTPAWLDHWIADPKAYNPDTAMPKLKLTDQERHDIVAYLVTLKRAQPLPKAPDLSGVDAAEGKKLVKNYECFGCHAIAGFEKVRPSVPDLSEFARRPVDELDFGTVTDIPRTKWDWLRRKLKDPRGYDTDKIKLKMPYFNLTKDETDALITRSLAFEARVMPEKYTVRATVATRALREANWMVAHLNCNGCHRINGKDARITQFLELKNYSGPTLEGVGARLQGEYMYQFLLEPKQVRPWLKMRMPTFGFTKQQAQTLVAGFAAGAGVHNPYTYVAKADIPQENFQRGLRRFAHYKCMQCHPTSIDQGLPPGVDPADLSINLMLAKERLRPEWIHDFLARPKQIAGVQTRMPTVFYTVDGVPKVEKPQKDINDLTTYLMGMTEPPEKSLKALQAKRAAEKKKEDVDWSNIQY